MKDKETETDRNNGNPLSAEDLIAQCLPVYTELALKQISMYVIKWCSKTAVVNALSLAKQL